MGAIMRCVDDSLAYHFMEKYHGYSMPVDSIIDLIGSMLGSTNLPASTINPEECFTDDADIYLKSGIANPKIRSGQEMVNTSLKPPKSIPWNSNLQPPAQGTKVVSGGFRPPSPKRDTSAAVLPNVEVYPPKHHHHRSPKGGLGVLGGFGGQDSVFSNSAVDSLLSPSVEDAMRAVKDELNLEAILPSLTVEKVLSDEQMEKLGTHKASFDQVAKAIARQNEQLKRKNRSGMKSIGNFSRNNSKRSDGLPSGSRRNTADLDLFLGLVVTKAEKELIRANQGIDASAYPVVGLDAIDDDTIDDALLEQLEYNEAHPGHASFIHLQDDKSAHRKPSDLTIHGDSFTQMHRNRAMSQNELNGKSQSDPVIMPISRNPSGVERTVQSHGNFGDLALISPHRHGHGHSNHHHNSKSASSGGHQHQLEGQKSRLVSRNSSEVQTASSSNLLSPAFSEHEPLHRHLAVHLPITAATPIGHCNHDSLTVSTTSAPLHHSMISASSSMNSLPSARKSVTVRSIIEHVEPMARPMMLAPRSLKTKDRLTSSGELAGPLMPYASNRAAYDVLCGGVPAGVGLSFVDRTKLQNPNRSKVKPGTLSVLKSYNGNKLASVMSAPLL